MSEEVEGHPVARQPGEVTQLLEQARQGSDKARDRLLEIVYDELMIVARSHMRGERSDHTLGATGLVNESYLRLFRATAGEDTPASFEHRHAFYKAAATAMRRILIDHARARVAAKRGGKQVRSSIGGAVSLDVLEASAQADPVDLLSLDDALCRLEKEDERAGAVVRLRFYGGRSVEEIAELLGVSSRTVKRDWEFARARLQQLMEPEEG
ncbi:MAG: ECF-type sigma factor [Phycisphaerales bacterium JB065]